MPPESAVQRLASLLLGESVVEWCRSRRNEGASYREIAIALRDATDGQASVTDESIRQWLIEPQPTEAAS